MLSLLKGKFKIVEQINSCKTIKNKRNFKNRMYNIDYRQKDNFFLQFL